MILYYGTKVLWAKPMTLGEYNKLQGWTIPADQDPEEAGYLVEYTDGGKSNHPDYEGYISWSPKNVFEKAYRVDGKLTFGDALLAVRSGKRVWRKGWKEQYIYYVPPGKYPANRNSNNTMVEDFPGGVPYTAYIAMKTYDGEVTPWVPTQEDMLAKDWSII